MWRALVVDDDLASQKLLQALLDHKAECEMANNGREAIEAFERSIQEARPYDLMFLDMMMPLVDGRQTLDIIRHRELEAGIDPKDRLPIIVVTAFMDMLTPEYKVKCDDYFDKPIRKELLDKAEKILASRQWAGRRPRGTH